MTKEDFELAKLGILTKDMAKWFGVDRELDYFQAKTLPWLNAMAKWHTMDPELIAKSLAENEPIMVRWLLDRQRTVWTLEENNAGKLNMPVGSKLYGMEMYVQMWKSQDHWWGHPPGHPHVKGRTEEAGKGFANHPEQHWQGNSICGV